MLQSALLAAFVLAGVSGTAQAAGTEQYAHSCATCHQAGVLGAPKAGDKAAWAPRLKQGMPTLIKHAKEGYKNMPARGLCNNCSDEEYASLIKMMAN
jgi:cytochrome c5